MTPYSGLLFFYIMALMLLPAVALGLAKRPLKNYGLLFSVIMLCIVFGENNQLFALTAFFLWETALCLGFFRLRERMPLCVVVMLAVFPLALVKIGEVYSPFAAFRLLGISYMTFRSVQVLLETHDGILKGLKPLDFAYFLLFFPSVSSGPIDRCRRFFNDIEHLHNREEYIDLLRGGVWKLLGGAFSAIVLGGLIWQYWLLPLPQQGAAATAAYMYGYTLFLFFNFAGSSSMAIGTAYILGVRLPENFNQPFFSVDMKDFWGRWHISLSAWLRDYVYTRFVRAQLKAKRFKNPRTAAYLGYLLNMAVMGVWHGLSPHYLIYGLYHGLLLCGNEWLDLHWKAFRNIKKQGLGQVCCVIITFHLFSFGLLIFSGRLL